MASLGRNHLFLRRYTIEAAIAASDWDEVDRHASALEAYAAGEPLRWCEILGARAHALAANGRAPNAAETQRELRRVRAEVAALGANALLPAIDAALGR